MVETRRIGSQTVTFRRDIGRGPSLVCIHGAADNYGIYDRLLAAMPERSRYAINLPGRAGTDGPALTTVKEMEGFLGRFVESEVQEDYWLVGHSLGGAVAIEHALSSPSKRLRGLVLLATGARLRVHPMILQLFEDVAKSGRLPPLPPGLYEQATNHELAADLAEKREATPIQTGGADWQAADSFDRMQDLRDIQVPALIIAGSEDPLTPQKYATHLAAEIPQSELQIIHGAGHMFVAERAKEVARAIDRQVASLA